tara:strand:- start:833 stop:1177 length:345 start_codon:yes stop_codon:yes gene_type:complete
MVELTKDYNCVLLYLFLLKIKNYEEELFNKIKNIVGLPLLNVGDIFIFNNKEKIKFKIIRVCKIKNIQPLAIKNKQLVQYKYCYSKKLSQNFSFAYYIYDYFILNNLVSVIKQP